jgi:hypothetical protein
MAREQRLWSMIEKSRWAEDVPEELVDRLAAEVRTRAPAGRAPAARLRARGWWKWVAAAAAVLLFLGIIGRATRKKPEKPIRVARVVAGKLQARGRDQKWHDVREVFSGELYRVSPLPGSEARLQLDDGSKVRLERGMAFLLDRGFSKKIRGERNVELLSGALTANVARDESEKFVVSAPGGQVTATGTRFWVRAGPPEGKEEIMGKQDIIKGAMATALAVAVFEGSVLVEVKDAAAGEPVAIQAGEETKPLTAPKAPPQVGPRTVANAIPADALVFVATAGRSHWVRAVENSNLGAAYREEKVKLFFKPLLDKLEALIKERKKQIEEGLANTLKFSEIEAALQGEVGVAIVGLKPNPKAPPGDPTNQEPVFLFVAEVGEHAEAFETGIGEFIKRVQAAIEGQGGGRTTLTARTYRGTDLRVFGVDKHRIAYARTKGYFLLAFDAAQVEKGIDCLEGKSPSLASAARIRKVAGNLLKISVDAASWMKIEKAKRPGDKQWKDFATLGFDQAGRLDYRLRFDGPLFYEEVGAGMAKASGVLGLLEHAKPVDAAKLAADAPENSMAFLALKLPTEKIIAKVLEVMDASDPNAAKNLRKGLVDMKLHGLDLEGILTESLTGEIAVYVVPAPGLPVPEIVLVARLKSNAKVLPGVKTLATILVHDQAKKRAISRTPDGKPFVDYNKLRAFLEKHSPKESDYRGGKLMFIPAENPKPGQPVPAAVILKDRLIVASTVTAAKRAAARLGGAGSLAKKKAFADGLGKLPKDPIGVQYMDTAEAFKLGYALAATQAKNWKFLQRLGVDAGNLPPAADISKHLAPEVTALYADSKGLALRAMTNVPRVPILTAAGIAADKRKKRQQPDVPPAVNDGKAPQADPEPGVEEF